MKVLTFSKAFPKGHPRQGELTHFVEKVWNTFRQEDYSMPERFWKWVNNYPFKTDEYLKAIQKIPVVGCKHHTIRSGNRWKVGDMASLRTWSGLPYRSKQTEFTQVEVKKVWNITMGEFWFRNDAILTHDEVVTLAENDGLTYEDFINWFKIHPNSDGFSGQIICWSDKNIYA